MNHVVLSADGRITIPAKLRNKLGLSANVQFIVTAMPDGSIVLRPRNRSFFELQGMLKAQSDAQVSIDDMSLGSA